MPTLAHVFIPRTFFYQFRIANKAQVFPLSILVPDVTYGSGPVIINRHLSDEDKSLYLKPEYRFRIVK